jgi:hypothetical protein
MVRVRVRFMLRVRVRVRVRVLGLDIAYLPIISVNGIPHHSANVCYSSVGPETFGVICKG